MAEAILHVFRGTRKEAGHTRLPCASVRRHGGAGRGLLCPGNLCA